MSAWCSQEAWSIWLVGASLARRSISVRSAAGVWRSTAQRCPPTRSPALFPATPSTWRASPSTAPAPPSLAPATCCRSPKGGTTYDLNLSLAQSFTGDFFHLASDGVSGTLVTEDQTAPVPSIPPPDDFYGSGFSDILWQNTDGTVAIWEMNG